MNEWKKVLALSFSLKGSIFFIVIAASIFLPFQKGMRDANFLDPDYQKHTLASAFMTWDSQHYIFLSDYGYHFFQESNRFYPLFPGLIHIASLPFHNAFWGGIIISNVVSFFLAILFFAFVKKYFSEKIAWMSTILFLTFPTAFYLSLIYSEGLFLFLTLCFFWFLYKKEFFLAGLFSLVLPLVRPVGIFIIVPFGIYILQYVHEKMKKQTLNKKELVKIMHTLWPIAGFGLLLLFYQVKLGQAFTPFILDRGVAGQWNVWNIFHPMVFLKEFFSFPLALHGFTNSLIDRTFFILFLIGLPLVYKKTTKSLFFYYLFMGGVPFFGNFMSYTRYFFVAFPIFIALGSLFQSRKFQFLFLPIVCMQLMIQTFFLILHSLNYWVA